MGQVGGALAPAARHFAASHDTPEPAAGRDGVRWLASEIERHLDEDPDGTNDHHFVEGAGAFLGLLLVDRFGGRTRVQDGCHRVQLGRFGWFDPFVAVAESLDADDARAYLAQYLSVAEQEAAGEGPVSGVVALFARALAEDRPDLRIESQFELSVVLSDGTSVDLKTLERVCQGGDAAAANLAARRIVGMLPGGERASTTEWAEAESRIMPRLVSQDFLSSLPEGQCLAGRLVAENVHLTLQLRYGPRARYVGVEEAESWVRSGADPVPVSYTHLTLPTKRIV